MNKFRLKSLTHKRRFSLLLILIYIISLPIISTITYFILRQNEINHAYQASRLYIAAIEAAKQYVKEELRPVLRKELPDKFILEGMSRSYVAGSIARRIQEGFPDYIFKNASINPMNLENTADEVERKIINDFRTKKDIKEWKGFISKDDYDYYVIARAGTPVEENCLYCHGDPAMAPKEVTERYGTVYGFNMKVGEVVNALIVYAPLHVPLASAMQAVVVFIAIYTVFFGIILWLINRRFGWFYEKIESDKRTIEDIGKEVLNLNREMEDIVAERTMGMIGLKVADSIRNPVTIIGGLCRQLSKKEREGIPKDKLEDIMSECQKMEKIVTDFDELVRSKRFLFKREDLNEITHSTVRLVENEIKDKNLKFSINLSDNHLMFNANRQLIRIAIRHLLSNAIDATASGGSITISSGIKEDRVFLTISDTGKGMTSEELHRIFEAFYSTKGRTGMGLPLIKQIISEHMGEVIIDSKLNVGTNVQFIFPTRWRERDIENYSGE